jgi:uncharacterized protein (TIGR03437 family)
VVSPGGWAQIKVFLDGPRSTGGNVSIDFDPSFFGDVAEVATFSPAGDAYGLAHVNGSHVDAWFISPSGGLGQAPGLPVFAVTVAVLPGLPGGTTAAVTAQVRGQWNGTSGSQTAATKPGSIQVGGTLSIHEVSPAGGLIPQGTTIRIDGTGFDSSTQVSIEGVNIASTRFVSPQQIEITSGSTIELTGRRLHVTNVAGEHVDRFLALSSAPSDQPSRVHPLLGLTPYKLAVWPFPASGIAYTYFALQNPTLTPVVVQFFDGDLQPYEPKLTIPPGATYFPSRSSLNTLNPGSGNNNFGVVYYAIASAPIRMTEYNYTPPSCFTCYASEFTQPPDGLTSLPSIAFAPQGPYVWNWSKGAAAPVPVRITLGIDSTHPLTISISDGARQWLTVGAVPVSSWTYLDLTPNPSSLAPATYTGTVTATVGLPDFLSGLPPPTVEFQVTLNVSAATSVAASEAAPARPSAPPGRQQAAPRSGPRYVPFPHAGDPLTLYLARGEVVQAGPSNIFILAPTNAGAVSAVSVQTLSGGDWLSAGQPGFGSNAVPVGASAVGLGLGVYQGTVTITYGTINPVVVSTPLTLTVLGPPSAPLTANPPALSFTGVPDQHVSQELKIDSPSGLALFGFTYSLALGASYALIEQEDDNNPPHGVARPVAPGSYNVSVAARSPGTYLGGIQIAWDGGGSLTVPVTLSVTATAATPPVMAEIVNAASQRPDALSPGEFITVFGMGIGAGPTTFTLDPTRHLPTSLNSAQLLINGKPAPLLYTSAGQVNAIVPYEVGASGTATIQVVSNGLPSATWSTPVAPTTPGIFTTGGGVGQAAALNQDGSLNSGSNPAGAGTVVTLFATGCGQTAPAGITGSLAPLAPSRTVLPVTVTIGGIDAPVQYSGSAPGEVAGLIQINAVVPPGVTPGPAVPVVIKVGGTQSPSGVSIAVQ